MWVYLSAVPPTPVAPTPQLPVVKSHGQSLQSPEIDLMQVKKRQSMSNYDFSNASVLFLTLTVMGTV